jgi:hypothetical protein
VFAICAAFGVAEAAVPAAHATGTLTVAVQGPGRATASGIDCSDAGGDCSQSFYSQLICEDPPVPGSKPFCYMQHPYIRVTAQARLPGVAFVRWEGCDAAAYDGGLSCPIGMTQDRTLRAYFVDDTGPAVQLLEPSQDAARRGRMTLRASASDNVGVTGIEYFVRGTQVGSTTAPEGVTVDTTRVADGEAIVKAVAIDATGRSSQDARPVTIDNTAPTLAVVGADDGEFVPGTTLRWTIDAADSVGIASVECSLGPVGSPPAFGACSGGRGSHRATLAAEGDYAFMVRATDTAGNVTTSRRLAVTIDRAATATTSTGGTDSDARGLAGFRPLVRNSYRTSGSWTRFLLLSVSNLPAGSRAELSCKGRGCPLGRKRFQPRRGQVSLLRALKGRRLRAGIRLTVRAIGPRGEQKAVAFTMRRGKPPRKTVRCAAAGGRFGRCG